MSSTKCSRRPEILEGVPPELVQVIIGWRHSFILAQSLQNELQTYYRRDVVVRGTSARPAGTGGYPCPPSHWDTATRRKRAFVMSLPLPGGRTTSSAGLWDLATDRQIGEPPSTDSPGLTNVAFNPGGYLLATARESGAAILSNIAFPAKPPSRRSAVLPAIRLVACSGILMKARNHSEKSVSKAKSNVLI
jgi:hypothetical protein